MLIHQKSKVEGLESNNAKLREELENHIRLIQESIVQYDTSYATHMDVLDTIADSLMNLLKSVSKVTLIIFIEFNDPLIQCFHCVWFTKKIRIVVQMMMAAW